MNSAILNREFQHPEDGWYQIEPKGDHPNRPAGIVQVIDDEATASIVNQFNAEAEKPGFSGMLVDHEHFRHDEDNESRAYGWLMKLQNRTDGIYGQVRWTNTGKAAVDGGDYRFFSTEYDPADLKVLNTSGKSRRVRPIRLDGLTLTNAPNNKGGKPITNRGEQFRRTNEPADNNKRKTMKLVATKLGLSAEASEEAILTAVTNVMNRATTAEEKLSPLETKVTKLEADNGTLLDEQIAADLDGKNIKDEKVRNRLTPILKPMKNRAERIAFIDEVVAKPAAIGTATQTKLLNRDTKPPTGKKAEEGNNLPDQAASVKIMNRAKAIQKETPHVSLATAVGMAQAETENGS